MLSAVSGVHDSQTLMSLLFDSISALSFCADEGDEVCRAALQEAGIEWQPNEQGNVEIRCRPIRMALAEELDDKG